MVEEAGHSATNMATVHLWQALGFQIFATVPEPSTTRSTGSSAST